MKSIGEKMKKRSSGRKSPRKKFFLFIVIILFIWWYNNFTLTVNEVCFTDERINDVINIVQITDLHGAVFGKDNKHLIDKIEKQNPDLIVVTGDMYSNMSANNGKETVLSLLKRLAEKNDVYYINGEHDSEDGAFYSELESSGVNVMNYKDEIITVKNTKLHLYGINNVYYSDTFNLHNAFEPDDENYSILLAHASFFERFADFGIDLSICGDTHGGMFRLPVLGAVYDGATYFPERNGQYMKGTYTIGNSNLFISSGLGNYPVPARFCNRPEIVNIRLAPESTK